LRIEELTPHRQIADGLAQIFAMFGRLAQVFALTGTVEFAMRRHRGLSAEGRFLECESAIYRKREWHRVKKTSNQEGWLS
jgi:hypothetical protein